MESLKENLEDGKEQFQKSMESGISKTKRFLRKLLLLTFISAIIGIGIYMLYANWTYSVGTRAGVLVKISKKGMLLKTYEGQLNVGGFQVEGESGMVGNMWAFSVTDDAVFEKLSTLEGEKVTLTYQEIIRAMPWQGDTNYFITEVEKKE
ncbi:MAG: hypothetical protein ACPGXL_07440 [Chitinophagales bacterium]